MLPQILSDPYLLISIWNEYCRAANGLDIDSTSSSNGITRATRCVNAVMIALAHSLPPNAGREIFLTSGLSTAMSFGVAGSAGSGNALVDATQSSRAGSLSHVNCVQLIEEWISVHLASLLDFVFPDVCIEAARGCLELIQHERFSYVRAKVRLQVAVHIFYIMLFLIFLK